MTKEQAIKHLKLMQSGARNAIRYKKNDKEISEEERKEDIEIYQDQLEALNIAIKALEQQPSEEDVQRVVDYLLKPISKSTPSDDCISRTQAIEWIENLRQMDECFGNYEDDYFPLSEVIDRLNNVPPVTPTHGTCKDCKHRGAIYANGECYCDNDGTLRERNFYCKDFKRRE